MRKPGQKSNRKSELQWMVVGRDLARPELGGPCRTVGRGHTTPSSTVVKSSVRSDKHARSCGADHAGEDRLRIPRPDVSRLPPQILRLRTRSGASGVFGMPWWNPRPRAHKMATPRTRGRDGRRNRWSAGIAGAVFDESRPSNTLRSRRHDGPRRGSELGRSRALGVDPRVQRRSVSIACRARMPTHWADDTADRVQGSSASSICAGHV